MSKTFKALQRAAREQAQRQHRPLDEALTPPPPAPRLAPPSASRARVIALSGLVHDGEGNAPPRPQMPAANFAERQPDKIAERVVIVRFQIVDGVPHFQK